MSQNETKVDPKKLNEIIQDLDQMDYDYIEGFISNKKDKVRAIHRPCGRERYAKFCLYSKQQCRYCKRLENNSKYQRPITPEIKEEILYLHSIGKSNIDISKEVGFTNSAIRQFLKREGLSSNLKTSQLKETNCNNCNKLFMPKYHNRDKACSKECAIELLRQSKIKYSQQEIDKVIKLKQLGQTNNDIKEITGVNINKIKEITKENDLYVGSVKAQQNAYDAKLRKNPNVMRDMRDIYAQKCKSDEELEKIKKKLLDMNYEYISGFEGKSKPFKVKCLVCQGIRETSRLDSLNKETCKLCSNTGTSAGQKEVSNWVSSYGLYNYTHILPKTWGKEIDIYIPSLNLGIEYCGLYWHCGKTNPDKNRHYSKMRLCNDNGIRLITIFEDEWKDRNKQVKNFLKSVMGIYDKKVFARKCQIKEVPKDIAKEFLEDNHIQGKTTFILAIGLYHHDELVGLVTGNKHHRQGHDNLFVLNRLVFKDGVQIVGGASKLLKYLIKATQSLGYEKIISWSDNRWSEGNVYIKTGFKLTENLSPDYSYYDAINNVRLSKQSNKKKLLLKKGAIGDMSMTEYELAKTLELYRIWDCGKKRWEIDL